MYCIKCSMILLKKKNNYVCSSGYLEYSIHLSEKIDKLYISKENGENTFTHTGHYFCPQCGKQMSATECDPCKITIKPLMFDLIELHPHNSPTGIYF